MEREVHDVACSEVVKVGSVGVSQPSPTMVEHLRLHAFSVAGRGLLLEAADGLGRRERHSAAIAFWPHLVKRHGKIVVCRARTRQWGGRFAKNDQRPLLHVGGHHQLQPRRLVPDSIMEQRALVQQCAASEGDPLRVHLDAGRALNLAFHLAHAIPLGHADSNVWQLMPQMLVVRMDSEREEPAAARRSAEVWSALGGVTSVAVEGIARAGAGSTSAGTCANTITRVFVTAAILPQLKKHVQT
mmetsp:Transcript_79143/g.219994  ORF Transcript_79143/g.219994 Transcript_79143/m.219994 type:complete len:243 (-) Transcript_79143:490-1218(-)